MVVTLGNFATKLLLRTTEGITRLRGKAYPFRRGVLVPTFHPAAVLRGGGEAAAQMRADLVRAKRHLPAVSSPPAQAGGGRVIKARTTSVEDTRSLAAELSALAKPGDLVLLAGDLGAGKTAFVQGFARGLGVVEPVTSPAFVLARSYEGRLPLLHLDVYRLEHHPGAGRPGHRRAARRRRRSR